MRWLPVLCYLGIGIWQFVANYDLLFPSDPIKRQALQQCFAEDHRFNPLNQSSQEKCFEARTAAAVKTPIVQANFVDLWKAHGQGPVPGNDIRRTYSTVR